MINDDSPLYSGKSLLMKEIAMERGIRYIDVPVSPAPASKDFLGLLMGDVHAFLKM